MDIRKVYNGWKREIKEGIMVKFTGETIKLSGGEQICLMVKGWNGTWKEYFNDCLKPNIHSSFMVDGAKLYAFEKDNKVKFHMDEEDITWTNVKRAPK